jgi:hypothetical protein
LELRKKREKELALKMEENAKQEKEDIEARKLKAEEKLRIVRVNRDH